MKNLKLKDKHGWDSVGIQSKNVIEVDPGAFTSLLGCTSFPTCTGLGSTHSYKLGT